MAELVRRTICEMRRARNFVSDIIKSTDYAKSIVYSVVASLDSDIKVEGSWQSPRSDRNRTKRFLAGLKRTLKSDPSQSMSKLAQKRSVSRNTISKAVKEYLGMKSYVTSYPLQSWKMPNTSEPSKTQRKTCPRFCWRENVRCWWGCKSPEQSSCCLRSSRISSCGAEQKSLFCDSFCSHRKWR